MLRGMRYLSSQSDVEGLSPGRHQAKLSCLSTVPANTVPLFHQIAHLASLGFLRSRHRSFSHRTSAIPPLYNLLWAGPRPLLLPALYNGPGVSARWGGVGCNMGNVGGENGRWWGPVLVRVNFKKIDSWFLRASITTHDRRWHVTVFFVCFFLFFFLFLLAKLTTDDYIRNITVSHKLIFYTYTRTHTQMHHTPSQH